MAYLKQGFQDGQILTAEQLNHIEEFLASLPEDIRGGYYTKTEIDNKGYLTLDTLPKYNGGVS